MRSTRSASVMIALVCLAAAVMGVSAAGATGEPTLTITASPDVVATWQGDDESDANESTLTVTATDGNGNPAADGTTITLSIVRSGSGGTSLTPAPAGPSLSATSVSLTGGSGTVTYRAGAFPADDQIQAEWVDGDTTLTASVTIATCVDPSDEDMCPFDEPLPIDELPCNPSSPIGCLPEDLQAIVLDAFETANCIEHAADPTTCLEDEHE